MPAASTTARTEPPAMTPVPCEAGFSMHPAGAELLTCTSWGIVVPTIGILIRFFFASSTPLRMASGHLAGLAQPDADVAVAVTDDDDRAEAEAAAALDDLGDAVDLDDALLERELVGVDACHGGSFRSELEAGFAGGIGERLDPPVVPEPGSIEDDALDAGGLGPLGDERADDLARLLGLGRLGAARAPSRRSRQRPASGRTRRR